MTMYLLILCSVLFNFVRAEESQSQHVEENPKTVVPPDKTYPVTANGANWHQHFWKPPKSVPHNVTYFDKAENLIRLPDVNKYNEEKLIKQSKNKKYSKRTVQKIIKKKNKIKVKKMYVKMPIYSSTKPNEVNDRAYNMQDDNISKDEATTTQPHLKKRPRKWSTKIARYPMPFQKHKNLKRERRDARDLYILKDFDEMKFLSQKKDYNVVNAHVKKYW